MVKAYKKSSVWLGLKALWPIVLPNLRWLIGNGCFVNFWKDNWLGNSIAQQLNIHASHFDFLDDKVSDFITDGRWALLYSFSSACPAIAQSILRTPISLGNQEDCVVWSGTSGGSLSAK